MSITISIGLGDDSIHPDALDRHMQTLGFTRAAAAAAVLAPVAPSGEPDSPDAPVVEEKAAEPAPKPRGKARAKDAAPAPAPAISTNPEDRRPPEETAAEAEQDAADEAAEVEATRAPDKPLTADDLKAAMGAYVNKHGLPATQEDGSKLFLSALGTPPNGEPFWKVTLVAGAGQEALQKAVAAWTAAAAADTRYGA